MLGENRGKLVSSVLASRKEKVLAGRKKEGKKRWRSSII